MIAAHLARNLRTLREARGLSQEQASRLAGIPRPTWSHLESGSANPTLQILLRVSDSMKVPLEELFSPPTPEGRVVPKKALKTLRRGAAELRRLLPDSLPGCELDRLELPAGAHWPGVPHLSGTREYLTCETGTLQITLSGEVFRIEKGEVLVFRGDQRHAYHNPGSRTAVGYSIVLVARQGDPL